MKIPISIRGWWLSVLYRLIEPRNQILPPSRRFKRRGGPNTTPRLLPSGPKVSAVVVHLLVLAAMLLILTLAAVPEQYAV
jgi:hypothetical protein